jgi:hypothetical protein
MLFLPVSPCLSAAGTAALELPPVAVLDDHIIGREQMALLAYAEGCLDDGPLKPMVGWIAASLADAGREFAGADGVSRGNRSDKALPEEAFCRPL